MVFEVEYKGRMQVVVLEHDADPDQGHRNQCHRIRYGRLVFSAQALSINAKVVLHACFLGTGDREIVPELLPPPLTTSSFVQQGFQPVYFYLF
jgi:hypothetical protein